MLVGLFIWYWFSSPAVDHTICHFQWNLMCHNHICKVSIWTFMHTVQMYFFDWQDNGGESLGELQELFDEIFQSDIEAFSSFSHSSTPSVCSSFNGISSASNKRDSSEISSGNLKVGGTQFEGFCMGVCPLTMLNAQTNCTDEFIECWMATFHWILDTKTKLKQSINCCHLSTCKTICVIYLYEYHF